jgi:alkyldihydroxyacetonephosphate synthase
MTGEDRPRSLWGWGYADRFPGDEARRETAERLERELGFPERPLLDPPTAADASVPEPRIDPPGLACCTADREVRMHHTYGRGYRDLVRGFRGEFDPAPDVVARPRDEDEVAAVLAWATDADVAVVPYGGGTSVVGGVEFGGGGYAGVVSLDTREMDAVREVRAVDRTARVGAGATGPVLNDQLADHDLQLRHYPQSYEFSTVGGWVATRAGGHFATRYTRIDDFLQGARAVTPAGTLETGGVPSSGAGPDPNAFLLGSEGAFGVVTEATLRVQPRPEHRSRATVRFEDWQQAVAATRAVVQARLAPAQCRLLDRNEAMLEEVAMDGSHVLLLGFESLDGPCEADLARALAHCEDRGGTVTDGPTHVGPDERDRGDESGYRSAFFEAPYRFNELVSLGVLVDTFETAVTWERFHALHDAVQERVLGTMIEECGAGFVGCRFTHVYPDGPAPYYTLLAPAEVGRELEQWRAVKRAASDVLADHGATITHHHAVGRVHREHYDREVPEQVRQALGAMKRTLDPDGVMNPGVLVD